MPRNPLDPANAEYVSPVVMRGYAALLRLYAGRRNAITIREIGRELKLDSPVSAHWAVEGMVRLGMVERAGVAGIVPRYRFIDIDTLEDERGE